MSIENKLLVAFAKATLSNIPLAGGFVSEGIGLISDAIDEGQLENRFDKISRAILEVAPSDLKNKVLEILSTSNFAKLKSELDGLYFRNGADNDKSYEVFIYAWHYGAIKNIDNLENQDLLTLLLYISGMMSELCNRKNVIGERYISDDANNKLIELLYYGIAKIDKDGVRASELAALYLYVSRFLFEARRFKEAAVMLMACLEQSLMAGVDQVSSSFGFGFSRAAIIEDIGVAFDNEGLKKLAIIAYTQAFHLYKQGFGGRYRVSVGSTKAVYRIAQLYASMGQAESAILKYREYLDVTQPLLEDENYSNNLHLWSKREHSSYYIMENSVPSPDVEQLCLCGSGVRYRDCCLDFVAKG